MAKRKRRNAGKGKNRDSAPKHGAEDSTARTAGSATPAPPATDSASESTLASPTPETLPTDGASEALEADATTAAASARKETSQTTDGSGVGEASGDGAEAETISLDFNDLDFGDDEELIDLGTLDDAYHPSSSNAETTADLDADTDPSTGPRADPADSEPRRPSGEPGAADEHDVDFDDDTVFDEAAFDEAVFNDSADESAEQAAAPAEPKSESKPKSKSKRRSRARTESGSLEPNAEPGAAGTTTTPDTSAATAGDAAPPRGPSGEARRFARRLQTLQQEQAASEIDPVGVEHLRRLARRAEQLLESCERAGLRLWQRTHSQLDDFETRLQAAQTRAEQDVLRLQGLGLLQPGAGPRALKQGHFLRVHQLGRRYPGQEPRLREQLRAKWRSTLAAEAAKRGIFAITDEADPKIAPGGAALAAALYRDAATSVHATMTVVRALDDLPEEAGRYHAPTVATRALQTMQGAPPYMKAQLDHLAALAVLDTYFKPPVDLNKGRKEKRATGKRKSTSTSKSSRTRRKAPAKASSRSK